MPKASSPPSRSTRIASPGATEVLAVIAVEGGWSVTTRRGARSGKTYPTRATAVEAAQAAMRAKGGAMTVQGDNGRVEETFILGRQAFEKISAVEGIRLSATMKRDLRDAQASAESPGQARRLLADKYGQGRRGT